METVSPKKIALIPILRSGLAMVKGIVPASKPLLATNLRSWAQLLRPFFQRMFLSII